MPEADFQYKPTADIRTYARIVNHITEAQFHTCTALNGTTFDPKSALQTDAMAGLEQAMDSAVKLKFLDAPLTKEQLVEFVQIPPRAK